MRILKNVLYVTTPNAYLSLDGENVVISADKNELGRVPLHNISGIISMGYVGASPGLMGKCAEYGIELSFLTQNGRFLARLVGKENGNVLLRKEQYRISDSEERSLEYAKSFIAGKVYNSRWILERALRDYSMRINAEPVKRASEYLYNSQQAIRDCENMAVLRGIEGEAASVYFGVIDELILQQKEDFFFRGRNKRPPLDNVNALLSFSYTLLAHDVASALSSVGLDSYVGFMHRDRPGRQSLALDIMEELRGIIADRFVITVINKKMIRAADFTRKENGAVVMSDESRKKILSMWQARKSDNIKHPFLDEKINWGLVPIVQAQLLARCIRGDLDAYPPFLWK